MRYINPDNREGESRAEVSAGGQVAGEVVQRIMLLRENELLLSAITGHFGGRVTTVM